MVYPKKKKREKNRNVVILIFNTAESTAELINSAVMLYLAKPLRDNPCGDVGIERWVHCLYV